MKKQLGKRIREYREKMHVSQEVLSDRTGLSIVAISNIERGLNYPSFEHFIDIANALNVSADALLCDIVNESYISKASELSEKLKGVSLAKRNQVFSMIELLLESDG